MTNRAWNRDSVHALRTTLGVVAIGFSLGSRGFIWKLYLFLAGFWLLAWAVAAFAGLVWVLAPLGEVVQSGTVLPHVTDLIERLVAPLLVAVILPEVPLVILVISMGPPIILYYVLSFLDALLSPFSDALNSDRESRIDIGANPEIGDMPAIDSPTGPKPSGNHNQGAGMSDLKATFEAAVATGKALTKKPSNDMLLKLYAYFKQATEGDVKGERPGFMDFVGGAKYDAWAKIKGTAAEEAMTQYTKLIEHLKRDDS